MMPVPMMPMAVTPVAVPAHFGGHLPRSGLARCCGAGTAQRHCLSALGRSGQHEQCADGGKPQCLRYVHVYPPWVIGHHASAVRLIQTPQRNADRKARMTDVNVE